MALWQISKRRWLRGLSLLYPWVTALAVLATGNHFLLDLLGGLVAIGVSFAIVWLSSHLGERYLAGRRVLRMAQSVRVGPRTVRHKVVTKSKTR